ncbi:1993_t:CDS:1, partial [Dentiscutata erythropus]
GTPISHELSIYYKWPSSTSCYTITPIFTATDFESAQYFATQTQLKEVRKTLYHACNLENKSQKKALIYNNITRCYNSFAFNTTLIINSILKQNRIPVLFTNITTSTDIIILLNEIKQATRQHFQFWTKLNPPDMTYWGE